MIEAASLKEPSQRAFVADAPPRRGNQVVHELADAAEGYPRADPFHPNAPFPAPHVNPLDIRPSTRPGSILSGRPLPWRPNAKGGLLQTLGKLLGSPRGIADLRSELLRVMALLEGGQPECARRRLERIAAHLWEIRRDGSQFVLTVPEWNSIIDAGASTLQVAEQNSTRPEIVAAIRGVMEKLEAFGSRQLDRSS